MNIIVNRHLDDIKNIVNIKIIEIASTDFDIDNIPYIVYNHQIPLIKFTDTGELFIIKDLKNKINQVIAEECLILTLDDLDPITGSTNNIVHSITGDLVDNSDPSHPVVNLPEIYKCLWMTDLQGPPTGSGRYWNAAGMGIDDPEFNNTLPLGTSPWQVFDWDGSTATVVHTLVEGDKIYDQVLDKTLSIQPSLYLLGDLYYFIDVDEVGSFPNWKFTQAYLKGQTVTDTVDNNIYVCRKASPAIISNPPSFDIYDGVNGHWTKLSDMIGVNHPNTQQVMSADFNTWVDAASGSQFSINDPNIIGPNSIIIIAQNSPSDFTGGTFITSPLLFRVISQLNTDDFIELQGISSSGKQLTFVLNNTKSSGTHTLATLEDTRHIEGLPIYADNTAALAGGLIVNDVYKTSLGDLRIVV